MPSRKILYISITFDKMMSVKFSIKGDLRKIFHQKMLIFNLYIKLRQKIFMCCV